MLVEREKILEAKEKLGDENAFLMAEILELADFDEKNLKACCPFHQEDTPSFIYNKKNYTFHCFGCGKTVDILDSYMYTGHTYLEACEKLFEAAKVPYTFGEKGVRTKHQYKYPHEEPLNKKETVYLYLALRGISNETVDRLDIRQDARGNCVFNYYDTNDVLTMVKYRPSHEVDKTKGEIKNWAQKDADTTPLLFNMNRINTSMPLLIVEGEIDCAAAIESGYSNTVSVPFGAGNFTWIENNWDWLELFDSIIIASDNDEAGKKMRKEVVYRLGSWRCKVVDIPTFYEKEDGKRVTVNDLNEMMFWYGKEAVLNAIINAKDQPVASVVDFSDIQDMDLSEIDGVYTGIHEFDAEMQRLYYGTFNIVTGVNGCVDAETEYFNGYQWKSITEYTEGEKVLQYNWTQTTDLVVPEKYHKYYNETFHLYEHAEVNQCVSSEHRMVVTYMGQLYKIPEHILFDLWYWSNLYLQSGEKEQDWRLVYDITRNINLLTPTKQIPIMDVTVTTVKGTDEFRYCFTVPSGMLVLRRKGQEFITGNSGKSSFLSQLICQSVDQGKDVWLYSRELPNYMSKNWINYIFAGNRHIHKYKDERDSVYYKVVPEARKVIDEYYREHIFIYKDDYENTIEAIEKSMEDSVRKYGSKLLIIDNLTAINFNCGDNEKWGKQVDFVNWCITFAKKFHVVVILVIHPKKIETMRRLTKFDVQGLGSIVDLAHRLISLYRVTPKDKAGERRHDGKGWYREPIRYDVMCDILKDRMRGRENLSIGLYYDPPSRRFFTNAKEYNYQYKWDNNIYLDELPLPKQLREETEVFGVI